MSSSIKDIEEEIYLIVFKLLNGGTILPNREQIQSTLEAHLDLKKKTSDAIGQPFPADKINVEKLTDKIATNLSIETETHSVVDLISTQHIEWMDRRRADIENGLHWQAYRKLQSSKLSNFIVEELDNSTDKILSRIEDPLREGKWASRGLVVGDVQSGKTTNFLGVINKGLDAGYKIIIVLSGLHNNLRVQTQERFEEGVTGSNSKTDAVSTFCGVAKFIDDPQRLRIEGITSRNDTGDFTRVKQPNSTFTKTFSINKKNVNTLTRLIKYIKSFIPEGQSTHRDLPLLLIDDEADHASVNTKKPDFDPSTINRLIKELLSLFDKNTYIGYTATPFANVLIDIENTKDLFPRNFIMCLGRAENYIGPSHVFGEYEDEDTSKDGIIDITKRKTEVDWFRNLDNPLTYDSDWQDFLPNKHTKDFNLGDLPLSLKEAIYSFLVGVSIRNLRGDEYEHKTMLIHITRFQNVQRQAVELVDAFVDDVYADLRMEQLNKEKDSHIDHIKIVYKNDFQNSGVSWNQIEPTLKNSASLIKGHVYGINGDFKDVIDEDKYPNGLTSIRIGGDKLSRGLTLPGLMTSYFLRTSRMYDTLMQMGRWFGYRDNYVDLCRIFTTGRLYNWYGHIANASEGLRARIEQMNTRVLAPTEYQQQIQSHPGMMLVTALNKQYHAKKLSISFNNSSPQIYSFNLSESGVREHEENLELCGSFLGNISKISSPEISNFNTIFRKIPSKKIIEFTNSFNYDQEVVGIWNKKMIGNYIKEMNQINELTHWTVVLFSNTTRAQDSEVNVGKFLSRPLQRKNRMFENTMTITRSIMNERSEYLDFTESEISDLKTLIPIPNREDFRKARPKERGLLVIYMVDASVGEANMDFILPTCAISFPNSENAKSTEFTVNSVEGNQDLDDEL